MEADGSILSPDLNGRYLYTFQYALSIPDEGDFYVIAEVFEDSAGMQTKTGTVLRWIFIPVSITNCQEVHWIIISWSLTDKI